jgi:dTDP-4-amino-4,6-dideoxygalactose transaminase
MDMGDAENRITKRTTGIVPVHLFLQTADMTACMNLGEK